MSNKRKFEEINDEHKWRNYLNEIKENVSTTDIKNELNEKLDAIRQSSFEKHNNNNIEYNQIMSSALNGYNQMLSNAIDTYNQMLTNAIITYNKVIVTTHENHINNLIKINQDIDSQIKETFTNFSDKLFQNLNSSKLENKDYVVNLRKIDFPYKLYNNTKHSTPYALIKDHIDKNDIISDNKEITCKTINILSNILFNILYKSILNKIYDVNFKNIIIKFVKYDRCIYYLDIETNFIIKIYFKELLNNCKARLLNDLEINYGTKLYVEIENYEIKITNLS